jgi:outer membrane lipoprotein-sorting protein
MPSPARVRRPTALALASVLALGVVGPEARARAATTCATPEECFARFVERQRDVVSVKARFRQVKQIALLKEPLESTGSFAFERDRGVRWEVEKPEPMVVEIDGEKLRAGPPGELRPVETGSAADVLGQMAGLFTGAAKPDQFAISQGRSEGGFRLEPRDPRLRKVVAAVELEIDPDSGAPRAVEIEEAGGDRTRIEMSDTRIERSPAAGSSP